MGKLTILIVLLVFVGGCASREPFLQGDEESSINELKLAVKMSSEDLQSRIQLGKAYAETGQLQLAVAQFDSALAINPRSLNALFEKGRALCSLGFEKEGKKLIRQVLEEPGGNHYAAELGRELRRPYHVRQLTTGRTDNAFADWLPNAKKLVFQSNWGANWDIYSLDLVSDSIQRLTSDLAREGGPTVSADGRWLAFTSTRNAQNTRELKKMQREIYLLDLNVGELRRLTFSHSDDWHPVFSPDGRMLYYVSRDTTVQGSYRIFMLELESGQHRPVTSILDDAFSPAVSPEGSQLLFIIRENGNQALYELDLITEESRLITKALGAKSCPDYSPDGQKIVFTAKSDQAYDIYLINRDGSDLQQLTNDSAIDGHPRFSPDGTKIVFHSNRTRSFQLYEIDLQKPATLEDLNDYFHY